MSNKIKFELSNEELSNLEKRKEKVKKKHGQCGFMTYSFTPIGVGNIVKVHFSVNDKTYDITDTDIFD